MANKNNNALSESGEEHSSEGEGDKSQVIHYVVGLGAHGREEPNPGMGSEWLLRKAMSWGVSRS